MSRPHVSFSWRFGIFHIRSTLFWSVLINNNNKNHYLHIMTQYHTSFALTQKVMRIIRGTLQPAMQGNHQGIFLLLICTATITFWEHYIHTAYIYDITTMSPFLIHNLSFIIILKKKVTAAYDIFIEQRNIMSDKKNSLHNFLLKGFSWDNIFVI